MPENPQTTRASCGFLARGLGLVEFLARDAEKWPDCLDEVPYDFKTAWRKGRAGIPKEAFEFLSDTQTSPPSCPLENINPPSFFGIAAFAAVLPASRSIPATAPPRRARDSVRHRLS